MSDQSTEQPELDEESEGQLSAEPQDLSEEEGAALLMTQQEQQEGEQEEQEQEQEQPTQEEIDAWLKNRRKVSVGGEEIEITAEEAFNGYMRDADYRRKTERAAELTRAAESEREQIRQEREERVNQLDVLAGTLYQELVGEQSKLAELLDKDPVAYLRVKQQMEHKQALLQQAAQQRNGLIQQQEAERQRGQLEYIKAEREKLRQALPEWNDDKVRSEETNAIAETLLEAGYKREELDSLQDHRALLLARDAMRWRKQQAIRAKQERPEPRPPVKGGARTEPHSQQLQESRLLDRVKKTGSEDDAVALLLARGKRK